MEKSGSAMIERNVKTIERTVVNFIAPRSCKDFVLYYSFMIPKASKDSFDSFTVAAFSAKKYSNGVAFVISPTLTKFSKYFFPIKSTH